MAVGKKSIQRAAGSIRETKSADKIQNDPGMKESDADVESIHEKKFKVISSIKSDLPDHLL